MKATKWIVGGGAVLGIVSCFLDWASIELGGASKAVAAEFPTGGMDQGGPIFIFLLALPLIAAVVGIIKRMGRGMGVLALIGGLLTAFMGLVKYADIDRAAAELASVGIGSVSVASGYWLMFGCSVVCTAGGLIALIKPEPKPQLVPTVPQPQHAYPVAQ